MADRPTNTVVGNIKNGFLTRMMNYSPAAITVWLALANRANKQGYSFPSITTLEEDTGLSRHTVLSAIRELEATGEIEVQRPERKGKGSNKYTIPASAINAPPLVQKMHPNQTHKPNSETKTKEHTHTGVCDSTSASRSKAKPRVRQRLDSADLADHSLTAAVKGNHQPCRIGEALEKATGLCRNGETDAEWYEKLFEAGDHLNRDKFDSMPVCARRWIDDCLEAKQNGSELPDAKRTEAVARESEDGQPEPTEEQNDKSDEAALLAAFEHFGVTTLAAKRIDEWGPERSWQIIRRCEEYERTYDLTTAIKACRDFVKHPDKFQPDPDGDEDRTNWNCPDDVDEAYVPGWANEH